MTTLTADGLEILLDSLGLEVPISHFPDADVLNKPLDIGRSYLADIFCSLIECDQLVAYNSIQWPGDIYSGDFTIILPKLVPGSDPNILAFDLMKRFPECSLFVLPFPEGVHLRIMFKSRVIPRIVFPYVKERKDSYGRDPSVGLRNRSGPNLGHKKVVIEFSSPNIANKFLSRHLRSTILGAYISNLYESMGWEVVRLNYLGDWGKPMALLGIGWERFGSEEAFHSDPEKHLLDVFHRINDLFVPELMASKKARDDGGDPAEIESHGLFAERNTFFKRMEDGDEQALGLWKQVHEASIESYTKLYSRLNISFDDYSGESQVSPTTMVEVEKILKDKGLSEESGGSWIIDLKKHTGKSGVAIIRDRAGSSTYLLRDLAAVLERAKKYSFDKMVYVVAADQHTIHFFRLFKILELMGMSELASKLQHVHFSDGSHSKKAEHGDTLGDVLDQYQNVTQDLLKANPEKASLLGETAEAAGALGISALITHELSARRANDAAFDISHSTSFSPGTGPDLQYWHAKLCSALKASSVSIELSEDEHATLEEEDETNLLRLLIQYPDITHSAYKSLESAPVISYLTNVTEQLSLCFDKIEEAAEVPKAYVVLFETTRQVLENGMKLLGIVPAAK